MSAPPGQIVGLVVLGLVLSVALAAFLGYAHTQRTVREREMLSRERIAAMEHGLRLPSERPELPAGSSRRHPLQSIFVFLALGLALLFALVKDGSGDWVWGMVITAIGIANLIYWVVAGKQEWERQQAIDEAVRRAYIRYLEGLASREHKEPST